MFIKFLLIIVALNGAQCKFHHSTSGWHRTLYITWRPHHGYTAINDSMGTSEKHFFGNASDELVRDAKLKMRQTTGPRKLHETKIAYHVGLIIGKIREKYRNMLDIYREGQDHRHERLVFNVPGVANDWVEHYAFYFELIRRYELHIDHLVNVIEGIDESQWPGEKGGSLSKDVYKTVRPYGRRRANNKDRLRYEKRVIKEQKIKNKMRQKFLMRKIGLPENSTTAKRRFLNQWPVMNTWDDYFADMY